MKKKDATVPAVDTLLLEHQQLEERLERLNDRQYLTPAEQIEKRTIKKMKLLKKDQIAVLTRAANA